MMFIVQLLAEKESILWEANCGRKKTQEQVLGFP